MEESRREMNAIASRSKSHGSSGTAPYAIDSTSQHAADNSSGVNDAVVDVTLSNATIPPPVVPSITAAPTVAAASTSNMAGASTGPAVRRTFQDVFPQVQTTPMLTAETPLYNASMMFKVT